MSCHLLHIGFAKAASSLLQSWFQSHPQLCFSPERFGGFADDLQMLERLFDIESVDFRYFVTSSEVLGPGIKVPYRCPLYAFMMMKDSDNRRIQENISRVLSEAYPQARILIVTRGFESIIRSVYSEYVKCGGMLDFVSFLQEYKPLLRNWLDVDRVVSLYRKAFGQEKLIVLPYELLSSDPLRFFAHLETALGLEHVDIPLDAVNVSHSAERIYWYARFCRFLVAPVANRLSHQGAAMLYNLYGFKIVRPDRLGWLISWMGKVFKNKETLEFPEGYLDQFRGMANCLRERDLYYGYDSEYQFC